MAIKPGDNDLVDRTYKKVQAEQQRYEDSVNNGADSPLKSVAQLPPGYFGMLDVRTPFMLALEQGIGPLLASILANPFGFSQAAQSQANQTPFGKGGNDILAHLFGSSPINFGQGFGGANVPDAQFGNPLATMLAGLGGSPDYGSNGTQVRDVTADTTGSGGGEDTSFPATGGARSTTDPNALPTDTGAIPAEWLSAFLQQVAQPVQYLAGGGTISPDHVTIVGEQGPEAIVGDKVVPLQFRATGGSRLSAAQIQQAYTDAITAGMPPGNDLFNWIMAGNDWQQFGGAPAAAPAPAPIAGTDVTLYTGGTVNTATAPSGSSTQYPYDPANPLTSLPVDQGGPTTPAGQMGTFEQYLAQIGQDPATTSPELMQGLQAYYNQAITGQDSQAGYGAPQPNPTVPTNGWALWDTRNGPAPTGGALPAGFTWVDQANGIVQDAQGHQLHTNQIVGPNQYGAAGDPSAYANTYGGTLTPDNIYTLSQVGYDPASGAPLTDQQAIQLSQMGWGGLVDTVNTGLFGQYPMGDSGGLVNNAYQNTYGFDQPGGTTNPYNPQFATDGVTAQQVSGPGGGIQGGSQDLQTILDAINAGQYNPNGATTDTAMWQALIDSGAFQQSPAVPGGALGTGGTATGGNAATTINIGGQGNPALEGLQGDIINGGGMFGNITDMLPSVPQLEGGLQSQPFASLLAQNPEVDAYNQGQQFIGNLLGDSPEQNVGWRLNGLLGDTSSVQNSMSNIGGFTNNMLNSSPSLDQTQGLQGLLGYNPEQQMLGSTQNLATGLQNRDLAGQAASNLSPFAGVNPEQGAYSNIQGLNQQLGQRDLSGGVLSSLSPFGSYNPEVGAYNQAQNNLGGIAANNPNQNFTNPLMQQMQSQFGGTANNPEQQAFDLAHGYASDLVSGQPGQQVIDALRPVFEQNLSLSMGQLGNRAPNVFGTGIAYEGTDIARQALNDFNLTAAQAALQGQQNQISALGTLGNLGSAAGNGAFGRGLGAAQAGLQGQTEGTGQQMQASGLLGDLAAQAGQNPFQRALQGLGLATDTALQEGQQQLQGQELGLQGAIAAGQNPFQRMLQSTGLTSDIALQEGQQGLQAQDLLMQNAQMAAQNPFNRALGASQLGVQAVGQDLQSQLQALGLQNQAASQQQSDQFQRSFNTANLEQQAIQAQQQLGLQGQSLLAQMSAQAGQNPFNRALAAGQFGLQSQGQAFDQAVNPTLQLLLAIMGMTGPTAFQTVGTPA